MTTAKKTIPILSEAVNSEHKKPKDVIADRRSKELVIAFAGPVGCGIPTVKSKLTEILASSGYVIKEIKISDYIQQCLDNRVIQNDTASDDRYGRYVKLQEAGNALRTIQSDLLSEYAIKEIAEHRTSKIGDEVETDDYIPLRTAYIIDQLKHQDEVTLLRAVYGNLFYLFGVLSTSSRREARLRDEGVDKSKISELIERDRKQREKNGQQLDKTLQLADFFVRNDYANVVSIEAQLNRANDLIHGVNGITPSKDEYGMYVAYSSGLRSACLSRQVGASIMNDDGVILATGRNDVPKAGGGLYGPEHLSNDARCVKKEGNECYNDKYKNKLADDIQKIISSQLSAEIERLKLSATTNDQKIIINQIQIDDIAKNISQKAHEDTRLGGLIEFSRSIHAEMDAIVSLAYKGGGHTKDATLFTYTFPCHNCARHIVAAGIKRVVYLEPYEKSLATELHGDDIDTEGHKSNGNTTETLNKVEFVHFEGVAPRQYLKMFTPTGERKDEHGKAIIVHSRHAEKKMPEYLDDYRQYEKKVVAHLVDIMQHLGS